MTSPSISILIVNYNTRDLTLACLESIFEHPPSGEYEVIVVDNASTDGSWERIADRLPQVDLVRSEENLGFARGNNLAMERSTGDILFLLNSDTLIHQNTFPELERFLREHSDAAVVGGKHYLTDGSIQPTIKYFPRVSNMISESFFLHRLFKGALWNERETRL
ncbi:MAG: glycosyltransferase family 2 protein, partial [Candidatus Omnitrophica bacterium]|nr:glycosyltransferase family 2 protein [Candidatus Omnitrophota bacterium]